MKQSRYNILMTLAFALLAVVFSACSKVSPTGVLVGGSGVDDRVDMSYTYYKNYMEDSIDLHVPFASDGEYSFLVGSDSHVATDTGRVAEMIDIGLEHGDLLWAMLGDIADTSADYYKNLHTVLSRGKMKYIDKYFEYDNDLQVLYDKRYPLIEERDSSTYWNMFSRLDDVQYPFFSVVGNHDVTRNGWALFSSIFHSSFFDFCVAFGNEGQCDHFIFLDTASGTLGENQIKLLKANVFATNATKKVRHTFVFSHTNLFRPRTTQFSSTFPREELYFLLNKFSEWKTDIVFCGHVHAWDDRTFGNVRYITSEAMSERNNPNPGEYLTRVTCKPNGELNVERVMMHYTPNK